MKIILSLLLFTLFYGCDLWKVGSYPYAESYVIDASKEDVLKAVQMFRLQNPQYNVPDRMTLHGRYSALKEGQRSHWYHIYFYDKVKEQTYFTWIRTSPPRQRFLKGRDTIPKTTFALTRILTGFEKSTNHGDINKDFSWKENRYYKRRFEELYLDKIKAILEKNKNTIIKK